MNLEEANLKNLLEALPALRNPTVSPLAQSGWVAVETVIEEKVVREIIPRLKALGAEGSSSIPSTRSFISLGVHTPLMGSLKKKERRRSRSTSAESACAKIVTRSVCATGRRGKPGMSGRDHARLAGTEFAASSFVPLGGFRTSRAFGAWRRADLLLEEAELPPRRWNPRGNARRMPSPGSSMVFEEESDGPEKALESYRKALTLDPGNTDLAIKVAYDYLRRGR